MVYLYLFSRMHKSCMLEDQHSSKFRDYFKMLLSIWIWHPGTRLDGCICPLCPSAGPLKMNLLHFVTISQSCQSRSKKATVDRISPRVPAWGNHDVRLWAQVAKELWVWWREGQMWERWTNPCTSVPEVWERWTNWWASVPKVWERQTNWRTSIQQSIWHLSNKAIWCNCQG